MKKLILFLLFIFTTCHYIHTNNNKKHILKRLLEKKYFKKSLKFLPLFSFPFLANYLTIKNLQMLNK